MLGVYCSQLVVATASLALLVGCCSFPVEENKTSKASERVSEWGEVRTREVESENEEGGAAAFVDLFDLLAVVVTALEKKERVHSTSFPAPR